MTSKLTRQEALPEAAGQTAGVRYLAQTLLLWLLSASGAVWGAEITLQTDTTASKEGYLMLSWQTTDSAADADTGMMMLQQAGSADFSNASELAIPLTGAHTLTGLANGNYFFRVGSTAEGWSNAVSVRVAHHSLTQAWSFFALGLLLFLTLCGVIISGSRKTKGDYG